MGLGDGSLGGKIVSGSTVEQIFYSLMCSSVSLSAIVDTKIYPLVMPQNTELPAITYFKVTDISTHAFSTDTGLETIRMQVS